MAATTTHSVLIHDPKGFIGVAPGFLFDRSFPTVREANEAASQYLLTHFLNHMETREMPFLVFIRANGEDHVIKFRSMDDVQLRLSCSWSMPLSKWLHDFLFNEWTISCVIATSCADGTATKGGLPVELVPLLLYTQDDAHENEQDI